MTKFRLKDHALQKKLDEISNGDFTRKLEENSKTYAHEFEQYGKNVVIRVQFGEKALHTERFNILLGIEDLEQIQEYDPHVWNDFPSVTPPIGVWMRCERFMDDEVDRRCLKFINNVCGSQWVDCDGLEYRCDRFRPWDSEQ